LLELELFKTTAKAAATTATKIKFVQKVLLQLCLNKKSNVSVLIPAAQKTATITATTRAIPTVHLTPYLTKYLHQVLFQIQTPKEVKPQTL